MGMTQGFAALANPAATQSRRTVLILQRSGAEHVSMAWDWGRIWGDETKKQSVMLVVRVEDARRWQQY